MRAPISDFVCRYAAQDVKRMHMPGHKGVGEIEKFDITEVKGADSLYEADGIIAESEACASSIFGADTFYSTEGSSLAIRAMLYLASLRGAKDGERPTVLACRNVHKSFLSAAALLDLDVEWIFTDGPYVSAPVSVKIIEEKLAKMRHAPVAIYITSPDYLGNTADISEISKLAKKHGLLLLVDNAHGAYLKFLTPSRHPIDLGADMCTDSAHKTLPTLTGGAYLHISKGLDPFYRENAKRALSLFGSTSPSYLILASLDRTNLCLSDGFAEELSIFVDKVKSVKRTLTGLGYTLIGDEEMKITVVAKDFGYLGGELAELLRESGIECEFSDRDYLTLMPSPSDPGALDALLSALGSIEKKAPIREEEPHAISAVRATSIRDAMLNECELIPLEDSVGRILASPDAACPPAVPIIMPGEVIESGHLPILRYYGKELLAVMKQ